MRVTACKQIANAPLPTSATQVGGEFTNAMLVMSVILEIIGVMVFGLLVGTLTEMLNNGETSACASVCRPLQLADGRRRSYLLINFSVVSF